VLVVFTILEVMDPIIWRVESEDFLWAMTVASTTPAQPPRRMLFELTDDCLFLQFDENFPERVRSNVSRAVSCRYERVSRTIRYDLAGLDSKVNGFTGFKFNGVQQFAV